MPDGRNKAMHTLMIELQNNAHQGISIQLDLCGQYPRGETGNICVREEISYGKNPAHKARPNVQYGA